MTRSLNDAILHIASMPDLVAWFTANSPDHLFVPDDGSAPYIVGFDRTPTVNSADGQSLVYVRVTDDEAAEWAATPGVTILAQAPYGPGVQDAVYAALFADPDMLALYDAVYPREPYPIDDGEGGQIMVTPPERFGQMG